MIEVLRCNRREWWTDRSGRVVPFISVPKLHFSWCTGYLANDGGHRPLGLLPCKIGFDQ